jgi:tRNA threonylcarbamoyladenosine biosynthesis protein TsaE
MTPEVPWEREEMRSHDEAQTEAFGVALGRFLVGGELVALRGELGAGKTSLVRGLATGLGIDAAAISSPSFIICRQHHGRRLDLAHIDAWRLAGVEELEGIGWEELRQRSDLVTAVEWPERIESALPDDRLEVAIQHLSPMERHIELRGPVALIEAWRRHRGAERCRACGAAVATGAATAPFCSRRCQLLDLAGWFAEE